VNVRYNIECASHTDVGLRRSHNQDAHAVLSAADPEQWQQRGHFLLVADGMGAHAVGELASKMAADSIPHIYSKHAQEGPVAALRRAFVEANLTIHNRGQANREFAGMGTTATALVLRPDGAWVGHVGDSRAYRVRKGKIEQLSFDHSLLWELARRQKKSPEQIENVPSNVIIRSLGPEALVQVDVEGPHPLLPGDVFVLCSDGLSGPVDDRQIGAVAQSLPPSEAARMLVHLANLQGGPDNITAVVARIKDVISTGEQPVVVRASVIPKLAIRYAQIMRYLHALRGSFSWPLVSLLAGIVLAGLAIYSTRLHLGFEITYFLLAAFFLLAGLLGVILHAAKEKEQSKKPEPEVRPLRVYRQMNCTIDLPMVQEQCRTLTSLENRVREMAWSLDWDHYRHFVDRGRAFLEKNRFADAYREHCHAMLILLESLAINRSKEEAFRPLW
jgi:PPM family protein phosphatase